MASGGYRSSGGSTADFLEEWKAKREKMRAKQAPPPGPADGKTPGAGPAELSSAERGLNGVARAGPKEPPSPAAGRAAEPAGKPPGSPEEEKAAAAAAKGKSSGPSARKGKGQIEKRKLREKRRSTGVVNIPAAESLDEYDDDETGQKERKREDAITQQNTMQNEAASADPGGSYLIQESSRTVSSRYKSGTNTSEDDVPNRYSRTDRAGYGRYSRDANSSGNSVSSSALEKRIEELERELAKERQENVRLLRMTQEKEEQIGKLKEEIDLLNRELDDIEDENEQLKQENKTLLKVVGQLTR
uniref:Pro-apoptotic WT1 regulator n=1 Tax=Pelusios castaneus TaxID=367368 RepID=A0A8C8SEF1_9SAUR